MGSRQRVSASNIFRTRFIVTYTDGRAERRVVWAAGEPLKFPAPYSCYAERSEGKVRFYKSDVIGKDGAPVEICSIPDHLARSDGAVVRIPIRGFETPGPNYRVNLINIRPEVRLAISGTFRYKRPRKKRKYPPRVVEGTLSQPLSRSQLGGRQRKAGGSFWREAFRLAFYGALGVALSVAYPKFKSLVSADFFGINRSIAAQTPAVAIAAQESAPMIKTKGAFSERSARELKAAIRKARPQGHKAQNRVSGSKFTQGSGFVNKK